MIRSLFSLVFFAFVLSGIAQEKIIRDRNVQERDIPAFHSIMASGSVDIYVSQGERKVVVSAADREDVDAIETVVEKGILKVRIKTDQRWWKSGKMYNRRFTVYVSEKSIQSIVLAGSGKLDLDIPNQANKLAIQLSGSGSVTGRVQAKQFEFTQSGSGNIRISGAVERGTFVSSGSGNMQLQELQLDYCTLYISGSGNAEVNVRKELEATISGSGNVRYKGAGQLIRAHSSGSGRIQKIGS